MHNPRVFRVAAVLLAASALTLAACAGGDAEAESGTTDPTPTVTATAVPEATPTGSAEGTPTGTPDEEAELIEVAAPIVSVTVESLDSAPPQYVVRVVSAQPDGCYQFERFELQTDGTTINVTVLNTRPADLTVVLCAQQYGETTSEVSLGTLESGTEYTLDVNGQTQTFVAE